MKNHHLGCQVAMVAASICSSAKAGDAKTPKASAFAKISGHRSNLYSSRGCVER